MDTPELGPMEEYEDTHNEEGETTKRKKWTKLETRQLIALFKENENLWNIQSKDYGRKLKKRDTLQHIADKFKVEPGEVSRKLHNLRIQFCYELKKMKEKSLEQGSDEMHISTWPHFSSLLFLGHPEIVGQLVQNTITDDTELPLKEEEVIHNEEVETTERKKWTDWETRQLITLFKENESLWNRHSKDYRNRMKKRVTIRHIAEILKVEPDEVSRKLHNLRTQLSSELRKIKERSLDQEPDDIYTSSWPYFSSLLFITHPPTVNDVNKDSKTNPAKDHCYSEVSAFEGKLNESDVIHSPPGTSTASVPSTPSQKRKCETPFDATPYVVLHQHKGQEEAFGEFVASELRQIQNQANKRKLKKIIMEAIANIAEADAHGDVYEETS